MSHLSSIQLGSYAGESRNLKLTSSPKNSKPRHGTRTADLPRNQYEHSARHNGHDVCSSGAKDSEKPEIYATCHRFVDSITITFHYGCIDVLFYQEYFLVWMGKLDIHRSGKLDPFAFGCLSD
jgi:hypothetical protein